MAWLRTTLLIGLAALAASCAATQPVMAPPTAPPPAVAPPPPPPPPPPPTPARLPDLEPGAGVPPDRGPTAGPTADYKDVVTVLYGTDRRPEAGPALFGDVRDHQLHLGQLQISIPKAHKPGLVERPLRFFSVEMAEDPEKHLTVLGSATLTQAQFVTAAQALKAPGATPLVFVHGYNTSFKGGAYRAAQLRYDLGLKNPVFYYSFTSKGALVSYDYDVTSAEVAESFFERYLRLIMIDAGVRRVNIIAHSRGNNLVQRVLDKMAAQSGGLPSDCCGQLVMASPDVDFDLAAQWLKDFKGHFTGVTLYANDKDNALAVSAAKAQGRRAGQLVNGEPLIVEGVDSIDATATAEPFALNHDAYVESDMLQDVSKLIETGLRPPAARTPTLRGVVGARGRFWRFTPAN